jgi:hypothetical protein
MSINISAFLGSETDNLDARFIQAFLSFGFHVQLHPELTLMEPCVTGSLYLSVIKTPPQMLRMAPEAPLLIEFGYDVQKRRKKGPRSMQWPPRGVGSYTYEASSRTAAGRSKAAAAMQLLSMAILAKETGGYFYVDGDEAALAGDLALKLAAQELVQFDGTNFDAYVYRFESWPPVDGVSSFTWPQEIVPPRVLTQAIRKSTARFRYKFSWFHIPGILLVTYFLVVTLLYS